MVMAIAELCKLLGYAPTLLNVRGTNPWWDDCTLLKQVFPLQHLEEIRSFDEPIFDILFEIGNHTVKRSQRGIARQCIWILRKPFALQEIENSIYPISVPTRDLEGITEAWLLEDVTDSDDQSVVETIARVPVRHVPFVWTPIISEVFLRSVGSPVWKSDPSKPLFVRMVDTNVSSSSSSTIPLVIIREIGRRNLPIGDWKLHNGEGIVKSRFFRENVLKHCTSTDMSGACVGRQRCVNWGADTNCVALLHMRFNRLRPVLLDLGWAGVPVIHNSPAFKDVGNGVERFYYENNSISQGADAFQNVISDLKEGAGWFSSTKKIREEILRRWSPISGYVKTLWGQAIAAVIQRDTSKLPIPIVPIHSTKEVLNVVFSDMWESFSTSYNFFTLLLNEAGKTMTPPRSVVGHHVRDWKGSEKPDLVVLGPFGDSWKQFDKSVPKVHFTGENTRPIFAEGVDFNLGFDHLKGVPFEKYMRFPLWMTYINWFCADIDKLRNPKPVPLELCVRNCFPTKKKFCAFVVTNNRNPVRNSAFKWLSEYKHVDSGGKMYNNIGNALESPFGGGGGGEITKVKFYRDYKFCFSYENSSHPGYSTEKFFHAKISGCVPIYWGDPEAQTDFDMEGAIDARNINTAAELREAVRRVDMDDELYQQKAATPFMNSYKVDLARRTMSEIAKRMWSLMGALTKDLEAIPRFIGAKVGSAEASFGMEEFNVENVSSIVQTVTVGPVNTFTPEVPIVVTYVTWNFLGSLNHWLSALRAQTQALPSLKAHIFNGGDIPDETIQELTKKFTFVTFETVPSTSFIPADFPDFWDPTHYAWKLWVYHTMATRSEFAGKMIFYMDAGSVLCKWPMAWLRKAQETGICCLEDPREINDVWCSQAFCNILNVTDEERLQKQIWAGSVYFRSGHDLAVKFFTEAFRLGQIRSVLVGPRLSGVGADGKSYGHRQDQSVLSILVRRFPIALEPLDTVYGDHSMRKTIMSGLSIYAHRGNFNTHIPIGPGIDDSFIINLDRRGDRLEKFFITHPELNGLVTRWSATDGKTLQMTKELATLFSPNDFFWKKSVTGCALSHLGLWWKLVNDQIEISNYLIFEDDAKMVPGWRDVVAASMEHVPEDYDVLYLGGILPPNRQAFEAVLEPVTKYYSRIRPNRIFGQPEPTPYFHSCAYAYILSRRGANKIIDMIQKSSGYWTSADHIMCGPNSDIISYFLTPTVAGCYQDDDPAYASSQFNNFSRVDTFDSDLWNNDERFSKEEIDSAGTCGDIPVGILLDAVLSKRSVPMPVIEKSDYNPRFVCIKEHCLDFKNIYEAKWLFRLFGITEAPAIEHLTESSPIPTDCPIFILQRPHVEAATKLMQRWDKMGAKFKILHLSDEHSLPEISDSMLAYTLPSCVKILRFYIRNDFPQGIESKISVIPLGYRWKPVGEIPQIAFRELHWSFFGTNWRNRYTQMAPLLTKQLQYKCKFLSQWNDPSGLTEEEYLTATKQSVFIPCPGGQNSETFRFYEALECGCIPLVLKTAENKQWFEWVSQKIPILPLSNWDEATNLIMNLMSSPGRLELYRERLLSGWAKWLEELEVAGQKWLTSN